MSVTRQFMLAPSSFLPAPARFHYTDDVGEVIDEMFATEITLGMSFDHAPLANLPRMSEYSE
jgi:hypothetical protein